jgi:putative PEP-CTERM system TPR-repeat lipoprotein
LVLFGVIASSCFTEALAADPKASRFYEDALTRYEQNDMPGAVIQLKNALQIDKGMLPVHVLLGKALLANGEMIAAEAAFNEALRLGVDRAEVIVPLAQAVNGLGRPQDVLDDVRFPVEGLPRVTRADLLLVKAGAAGDLGKPREAMVAILAARALQPDAPESWLSEVPMRIRARQFSEARSAADRAVSLAPAAAEPLYVRGSVEHAAGSVAAALDYYERALKLKPAHLESLVARAGIYLDLGRTDEARADLEALRNTAPRDPRATYLRALLAERQGSAGEARTALADVTALLDPVPMDSMRYRPQLLMLGGLSHFGLGQLEKAKPYLEMIQRDQPSSPAAKLLGRMHVMDRSFDRAVEVLGAYLRSQPRDVQAQLLLADAHLAQGRHARAVQVLQSALEANDVPRLRAALGLALVRADRPSEALPYLEAAYRQDPAPLGSGMALANLYLRAHQPRRAADVASALLKRHPEHAPLQILMGAVHAQLGDAVRARAAFDKALSLQPGMAEATLNLARLDVQDKNIAAALQRLDQLLAREPQHVEALMERGLLAERQGRNDEAAGFYARAFDHSGPQDLKPGLMLITHYLRTDRVSAAAKAVEQLTLKAPDHLSVHMANARVAMAAKDLASTKAYLTRASRAAEFDPELQVQVARLQMQAQDPKGAQYGLEKALKTAPDHLIAQAMMVEAEIALGQLAEAEQRSRTLVSKYPRLAPVQALVGDVAAARGLLPAALTAYRRAHELAPDSISLLRVYRVMQRDDAAGGRRFLQQWLKKHPDDVEVLQALAGAYAREGDFVAAKSTYTQVLQRQPDNADALNNLAHVLIRLNDPGAMQVADRALALRPETPHVLGTAGWAAFQAGQSDRALQLLRDARLRDPSNAETRFYLATVLASAGRSAEARRELEVALGSGHGFASADAARTLLDRLR